jgi:hypothetical protein
VATPVIENSESNFRKGAAQEPWNQTDAAAFADSNRYGHRGDPFVGQRRGPRARLGGLLDWHQATPTPRCGMAFCKARTW